MVWVALQRTIVLLLMAAVGYISTKVGIIDKERSKGLSDVVMYILTPAVIVSNLQIDYDKTKMIGFVIVFLSTVIGYLVNVLIAKATVRVKDEDTAVTLRFAAVFPNVAYMGIPMVEAILGAEGVFYLASSIAAINLLIFTVDVVYMERNKENVGIKSVLTSPCVIAVFLGIAFFCLRIRLPEVVLTPISMFGNAVTPMAMLIAGYSMANTDFRDKKYAKHISVALIWKLIAFPLIYAAVLGLIPGHDIAKAAAVIGMACPTGTFVVFLAVKYDRNDSIASQMFTYATVLSSLSIPLIMWFLPYFGYHL